MFISVAVSAVTVTLKARQSNTVAQPYVSAVLILCTCFAGVLNVSASWTNSLF